MSAPTAVSPCIRSRGLRGRGTRPCSRRWSRTSWAFPRTGSSCATTTSIRRKLVGVGTYGSRSLISHGAALTTAAKEIVEKGRKLASEEFEVAPSDVTFDNGQYRVVGTDLSVTITTLIEKKWGQAAHPLDTNTTIDLALAYPSGAHVAEVEIDPETGTSHIVNYVAADDCGNVINHKLVEGQLHGGLMQGIGQVFGEHIVYDPDSGQLLSGTFMDYFMPRAHNLPPISLIDCGVPSPANSLGAKGAGEAGATGSVPALANAVFDALKSANVQEDRDAVHAASHLARDSRGAGRRIRIGADHIAFRFIDVIQRAREAVAFGTARAWALAASWR